MNIIKSLVVALPFTAALSMSAQAALTKQQIIDTVVASPAAVAIHDKQAWLNLFSANAKVEDPVGTAPHKAVNGDKQALSAFYNTFIAPNNIAFQVHDDIVAGNEMVRDVHIQTQLSTGITLSVPTHLRYKVVEENGQPKLQELSAHWELSSMIGQVLGDSAGLQTGAELTLRMLEEQGVNGALGYLQGLTVGIFDLGKTRAQAFATAVNDDNTWNIWNSFSWWTGSVEFPVGGQTYTLAQFVDLADKVDLQLSDLRSAGWYTTARFNLTFQGAAHDGVVFFEYDSVTWRLKKVRFFWD